MPDEEIALHIALIKKLKQQIDSENDLKAKNMLREQLRIARKAKERAFKLKAQINKEEALFILLHN